jgi:TonB family protein
MGLSRHLLTLACLSALCPIGWSQAAGAGGGPDSIAIPNVYGVFVNPVPDAPFFATVEVVSRQSLADGTISRLRTLNYIGRDSKGRTYTERRRFVAESYEGEPPLQTTHIYDPETGLDYRLDPYLLVAWRSVRRTPLTPDAGTVPIADPASSPDIKVEDLGKQVFEGMTIRGTRQLTTEGVVDEYWYSPDLSICTMRKHKDSKWEYTLTLTKLDRQEPDASRFLVSDGYKTVGQPARQVAKKPGTYTVGGDVTGPAVIHSENPQYTMAARRAKIKGLVVIGLTVDANGVPQDVHVVRGLDQGLDENAIAAVQQYRFKPAMREGKPVPVEVNIEVKFDIY